MKKYLSLIAVSVLALGINNANAAETTASGTATATILEASGVKETQSLEFGNVLKTADHTVVVDTNNNRSGTDAYLVGGITPKSGMFAITGSNGQNVTITVPETITLTHSSGTGTLSVNNVTMKIGSGSEEAAGTKDATISGTSLSVAVGGSLGVKTAAATGKYTGEYTVKISY